MLKQALSGCFPRGSRISPSFRPIAVLVAKDPKAQAKSLRDDGRDPSGRRLKSLATAVENC
jgi:hypothetical protein